MYSPPALSLPSKTALRSTSSSCLSTSHVLSPRPLPPSLLVSKIVVLFSKYIHRAFVFSLPTSYIYKYNAAASQLARFLFFICTHVSVFRTHRVQINPPTHFLSRALRGGGCSAGTCICCICCCCWRDNYSQTEGGSEREGEEREGERERGRERERERERERGRGRETHTHKEAQTHTNKDTMSIHGLE